MDVVVKESQQNYGFSESCKNLKVCPWNDAETPPVFDKDFDKGKYDTGLLPSTKDGKYPNDGLAKGSRFIRLRACLRTDAASLNNNTPQYLAFSFGNTTEIDLAASGKQSIGAAAQNKLPVNVTALIHDKNHHMHDFVRIGMGKRKLAPASPVSWWLDSTARTSGRLWPAPGYRRSGATATWSSTFRTPPPKKKPTGPLELLNEQLGQIGGTEKPRIHALYDEPSGLADPSNPHPNSLQRFVNRELSERLFGEKIDSKNHLVTRTAECVVGTGLVQIYLRVGVRFLGARSDLRVESFVRFFSPPSLETKEVYVTPQGNVWFYKDDDIRLPFMAQTMKENKVEVSDKMLEELVASATTNPCPAGFPYLSQRAYQASCAQKKPQAARHACTSWATFAPRPRQSGPRTRHHATTKTTIRTAPWPPCSPSPPQRPSATTARSRSAPSATRQCASSWAMSGKAFSTSSRIVSAVLMDCRTIATSVSACSASGARWVAWVAIPMMSPRRQRRGLMLMFSKRS